MAASGGRWRAPVQLHSLAFLVLFHTSAALSSSATRCKLQNCALQARCIGPFPAFLTQETAQNSAKVSFAETARFLCQETALAPVGNGCLWQKRNSRSHHAYRCI